MTQTSNRFFDEIGRLMNDAAGAAQGVKREVDTVVRNQAEKILRDLDIVKREEFEAVKDMARLAREENEALKARIAALEAKLGGAGEATNAAGRADGQGQARFTRARFQVPAGLGCLAGFAARGFAGAVAEAGEEVLGHRQRFKAGSYRYRAVPRLDRRPARSLRRKILAGALHAAAIHQQMVAEKSRSRA